MTSDPKDDDPLAKIIEQWIKFRESQGWTREAAMAEFAAAAQALLMASSPK